VAHRVTLIPGDGTGPELTEATRRVLEATGVEFDWDVRQAGTDVMEENGGNPLPQDTLDSIRENGVALKGPITTPVGGGFRSVNVGLRKELDMYAQVRPCKSYEGVRTRFDDPVQGGDNRSEAILLGVVVDRPRVYLSLSAGYRDSRPIDASRFRELRTPTGSYFASYLLRSSVEIFVNGFRGAEYSVSESNPYYIATSNGGGVNLRFGARFTVRAYGDYAENRYPIASASDGGIRRIDTIGTFGGGFQVSLGRRLVLGVFGTEYRYDSNVPGVARNIFRLTSLISFQLSPIVSIRGGLS